LKKKTKYVIGILLVVAISSSVLASYTGLLEFARARAPLLTVSLSVSGDTQDMHAGDNVTFTANVDGGQSPYTYTWTYYRAGDSPNPVVDNTNVFVFTADSWHTGTFTVTVTVNDYFGAEAFDSYTPITVIPEYTNVSVILLSLFLVSVTLIVISVKVEGLEM
jgi:hypothetical protein